MINTTFLTKKISVFPSLLFIILLSYQSVQASPSVLLLNATAQPPLHTVDGTGFMDEVLGTALQRINYKLVTVQLPAERGLKNANKGVIDGELGRVKGIESKYPNLIRVPEKIMDWEFVAYSFKPMGSINTWKDLSHKSVSFINGWKIFEKNSPKSTEILKVRNVTDLFNLLKKRRTDYVLYEKWGGKFKINNMGMKGVNFGSPPLAVKEIYTYLHSKHKDIIPELAKALKQMKLDGRYQALVDKHLK